MNEMKKVKVLEAIRFEPGEKLPDLQKHLGWVSPGTRIEQKDGRYTLISGFHKAPLEAGDWLCRHAVYGTFCVCREGDFELAPAPWQAAEATS